jgi:hypothetical protein
VGLGWFIIRTHWVNMSQFQNLIIHPKTSDFPRHEERLVMRRRLALQQNHVFNLVCQWQQERTHHPTNKPHIIKAVAKCEVLFTTTYKTTIWHQEQSW